MTSVLVVGAGIGGLTTAALLARAGVDVTVLEAHIYPGGCAGTFYHQGYLFDAGATLSAGFDPGGVMDLLGTELGIHWPAELAREAMTLHLPDGRTVTRWADPARWREERLAVFGRAAEPFWRWQERTADILWRLATKGAAWPPSDMRQAAGLGRDLLERIAGSPRDLPGLLADLARPVSAHLAGVPESLRLAVDAQLLISAQATAGRTNALYGAAALDLPRRGVAHVRGGMGTIPRLLVDAVRQHGGRVLFRQRVTRVRARGRLFEVETNKGASFLPDVVIFNLPPWDAAALLGEDAPGRLRRNAPSDMWGAFVVYAGLDGAALPDAHPLHHQVITRRPLGEGNSVFLSLSLADDTSRAPAGHRTLTMSTHTEPASWWSIHEKNRPAYEARRAEYTERVLKAASLALPGLDRACELVLPGTPVTFTRFTHRSRGLVGGYPQTRFGRATAPRLSRGLWLVGDSIFPGQSVVATALGGRRVAREILHSLEGSARRIPFGLAIPPYNHETGTAK